MILARIDQKTLALMVSIVAFLSWHTCSHSALWSGNELLKACSSKGQLLKIQCDAYVAGAIDASKPVIMTPDAAKLFCVPNQITFDKLRNVILSYLNSHRRDLQYSASALAVLALREEFPCK